MKELSMKEKNVDDGCCVLYCQGQTFPHLLRGELLKRDFHLSLGKNHKIKGITSNQGPAFYNKQGNI